MHEAARLDIGRGEAVQLQTGVGFEAVLESGAQEEGTGPPEGPVDQVWVYDGKVQQLNGTGVCEGPVDVPGSVTVDQGQGGSLAVHFA